jgi:cytochrome oxidase Cu insertion factor (SCO1/SenC/PrrC family)
MSRKFSNICLLSAIIVVTIAACSSLPDEFPAFDFTVDDVFTGEEINLTELKGRPVLIYFFASW